MLLPPDGRTLLTDVLRPPAGYRLDRAVATTFTLELDSLLTAPLAFAAHALRDQDDPISVMDGVRRCADRIDVFCQAGQIAPPPGNSGLLLLLEQAIHPVRRPRPGKLFHPKMWLVRYVGDDDPLLRLVVLSRNMTNDRSWDVCLSLDGVIGTRTRSQNVPVVKLLRHAIDLATQPVPKQRRAAVEELLRDLHRAVWQLPEGFFQDELYFHALGVPGVRRPDFTGTRHLVMSPFVTVDGLGVCAPGDGHLTVIGRQEELDRLPEGTLDGCQVLVLNDLAALDLDDESGPARLTGLHAKTYVVEYGRRARVMVGSANATDAAFTGNVELLVELVGSRDRLGIDAMAGESAGLRAILDDYERRDLAEPEDEVGRQLEEYLRDIATVPFRASVRTRDEPHELRVRAAEKLSPPPGGRLMVALLTRPDLVTDLPGDVVFSGLSTTEITRFLLLTAVAGDGTSRRAVAIASLTGDPSDRLDRVLAEQVNTPEKFLQFLMLLLGFGVSADAVAVAGADGVAGLWRRGGTGVLELLLGALADRPAQLDELAGLVRQLAATDRGRAVLPEGFLDLWQHVDQVRRELRKSGAGA
ncbi:phospholipase D family protein [Micromonospora sp. NPDC002717]|uniref:phospholipase D family protein n=1 Tax=Micromonospora sp. NPDC002717 TaxID=3154424 RepID=UPI003328381A